MANRSRILLAINLSLWANVVLALAKTAVGILGHSPALLADGINSTSDVAYLAIVRVFLALADKPPDREHPFGHRQLESIAAVVIGAFVVTTGIAIFWTAVNDVYGLLIEREEFQTAAPAALWVALGTFLMKIVLLVITRRIATITRSIAILALARDHRNDIISISTAALGIAFSRAGYPWVDPLAAAFVAVAILATGLRILRDSSNDLMDVLPDEEVVAQIRRLLEAVPGVRAVEDLYVHRIGVFLIVDATLGVDGRLSVFEGDAIANAAEAALYENVEYLRRLSIHYHPAR